MRFIVHGVSCHKSKLTLDFPLPLGPITRTELLSPHSTHCFITVSSCLKVKITDTLLHMGKWKNDSIKKAIRKTLKSVKINIYIWSLEP